MLKNSESLSHERICELAMENAVTVAKAGRTLSWPSHKKALSMYI
jgi:hypothetical protein